MRSRGGSTWHAADDFHASMMAHEDGRASVDTAPEYYRAVGAEERRAYFGRIRSTLGKPLSSSAVSVHVSHMQAGTFLYGRFQTKFERGDALEDFSWRVDQGRVYLMAYAAVSPLLARR